MDASPAGAGKLAFTLRLPIGIVGAISPFNFPLNLVAHKVAPALAAGCAVVLKPASQTPLSALFLAELETEAGLPAGWLNVVCGPAEEIGDVLVEDDRVKLITFTGSAPIGWKLRERAARKRVNLELGNATPVIVAADADLDDAAERLAANAFSFAGQSCISVQRIYVERSSYDEFLERFIPRVEALTVGDPADEATDVGPLISASDRDRILEWIEEAKAGGAEVLTGGTLEGELLLPTVIAAAPPDAKVSCEEVFGPLCTVTPFDTLDEAIALANSTRFGLQAGIFTARRQERSTRGAGSRVRRSDGERSSHVPRRPDALRRHQGLGKHARRASLRRSRDDRGTARRPPALDARASRWPSRPAENSAAAADQSADDRLPSGTSGASARAQVVAPGARGAAARPRRTGSRDVQARSLQRGPRRRALRGARRHRSAHPRDRCGPRRNCAASPRLGYLCLRRSLPARSALLRDVRPPGRRGVGREPAPVTSERLSSLWRTPSSRARSTASSAEYVSPGPARSMRSEDCARVGSSARWSPSPSLLPARCWPSPRPTAKRRCGARDRDRRLRHRSPLPTTLPPPSEGGAARHRGLAGGRGRLDDRARLASTDRRQACRRSSSAEGRRARALRRWGFSTPRSTRACIRATGSSSRASTDPRPRRRAICNVRADSRARPRSAESFPETLARCLYRRLEVPTL